MRTSDHCQAVGCGKNKVTGFWCPRHEKLLTLQHPDLQIALMSSFRKSEKERVIDILQRAQKIITDRDDHVEKQLSLI